jgi:hypothetical protein
MPSECLPRHLGPISARQAFPIRGCASPRAHVLRRHNRKCPLLRAVE